MERVVVTGIGAVSPVGNTMDESWAALLAGTPGVDRITLFDTTDFEVQIAAEAKGFDPLLYMEKKDARRNDRFLLFAIAAAKQAVADSGMNPHGDEEVGVIVGSGIGGLGTVAEQVKVLNASGPRRVSPFSVPMMITDMASGLISIEIGALGPNFDVTSACATGADAIGVSFETIRRGDARAIVTGGAEATIVPIGVAAFTAARALSRRNGDPATASRPFDKDRDGFVIGEGAAILVLESLSSAQARGAKIYAELLGHASAGDAFHITAPRPGGDGLARAMKKALSRAGVAPDEIDYINAHGTSTEINDREETHAIKTVFGDHAYRIPVNSTKSMVGHMLGATGAFEALVCCKSIETGWLHPTINQFTSDPDCDLDYVPNLKRQHTVRTAISNSLGFGGHNSALVFRALD